MQNSNFQCFLRITCASSLAMNFRNGEKFIQTPFQVCAQTRSCIKELFLMSQRELKTSQLVKIQWTLKVLGREQKGKSNLFHHRTVSIVNVILTPRVLHRHSHSTLWKYSTRKIWTFCLSKLQKKNPSETHPALFTSRSLSSPQCLFSLVVFSPPPLARQPQFTGDTPTPPLASVCLVLLLCALSRVSTCVFRGAPWALQPVMEETLWSRQHAGETRPGLARSPSGRSVSVPRVGRVSRYKERCHHAALRPGPRSSIFPRAPRARLLVEVTASRPSATCLFTSRRRSQPWKTP